MNSSNKSEYGEILTKIIKEKNMTQEFFYNKLGIAKPYFYDIIKGKINPPPPETQLKILKILNPNIEDEEALLNIAAKERGEIPADVFLYIKNNANVITKLRKDNLYKNFIKKEIERKEI